MPAVWRVVAHWDQPDAAVAWCKREGRVSIGWNPGDVRQFASPKDISEAVRESHPGLHNWPYSGQQLWDFSRSLRPGDLVIVSAGSRREVVMEVTGDYEFVPEAEKQIPHQCHQRTADLTYIDPDKIWRLSGGCAPGYNVRWTLIRCREDVDMGEV